MILKILKKDNESMEITSSFINLCDVANLEFSYSLDIVKEPDAPIQATDKVDESGIEITSLDVSILYSNGKEAKINIDFEEGCEVQFSLIKDDKVVINTEDVVEIEAALVTNSAFRSF